MGLNFVSGQDSKAKEKADITVRGINYGTANDVKWTLTNGTDTLDIVVEGDSNDAELAVMLWYIDPRVVSDQSLSIKR